MLKRLFFFTLLCSGIVVMPHVGSCQTLGVENASGEVQVDKDAAGSDWYGLAEIRFDVHDTGGVYADYLGAGHIRGITVRASHIDESATGLKTVDGSGLDDDRHSTVWDDGWLAFDITENPHPDYDAGYWLMYDFGAVYELSTTHVWNSNEACCTYRGLRKVAIDYSVDGKTWGHLGMFELPRATGSMAYTGSAGPDFGGLKARYVLITALSNWSGMERQREVASQTQTGPSFHLTNRQMILFAVIVGTGIIFFMIPDKKRALFSFMILDCFLLIDFHLFYNQEILSRVSGLQISMMTITLAILCSYWLIDIKKKRANSIKIHPYSDVFVIGYLLSSFLSLLNSENISMSMFQIFLQIQMLVMYAYLVNHINNRRTLKFVVALLLIGLSIESLVCIIQYMIGVGFNFTGEISSLRVSGVETKFYRPIGTGQSTTDTAAQISILLLMTMSLLLNGKHYFRQVGVWGAAFLGAVALFLSFTRGAWISFAVGFMMVLILGMRHHRITKKRLLVTLIILVMTLGIFSVPIVKRFTHDDNGSARSRIPLIRLAINMIKDKPIIGVGVNNFGVVTPKYLTPELRRAWIHLVHNKYLLVLSETGIVGLAFFLFLLGRAFQLCLRSIKSSDQFVSALSIGIFSGLLCYSLHMLVDILSSRLIVQLFWILLASLVSMEVIQNRDMRESATEQESVMVN